MTFLEPDSVVSFARRVSNFPQSFTLDLKLCETKTDRSNIIICCHEKRLFSGFWACFLGHCLCTAWNTLCLCLCLDYLKLAVFRTAGFPFAALFIVYSGAGFDGSQDLPGGGFLRVIAKVNHWLQKLWQISFPVSQIIPIFKNVIRRERNIWQLPWGLLIFRKQSGSSGETLQINKSSHWFSAWTKRKGASTWWYFLKRRRLAGSPGRSISKILRGNKQILR